MAGNRQHILPRFLLKGFASRIEREKIFTWVSRKGTKPFETTVENVSVEKYFYGKQGELSADGKITELEAGYARLINEIRGMGDSNQVIDPALPDFVAHLVVRTKQLRQFFRESADYLLDELTNYLSEPANLKRLLLSRPTTIEEELGRLMKNIDLPEELKEMLPALVEHYAPTLLDEGMPEFRSTLKGLMADMKQMLPKAIKEGHIKSLANHPVPETRSDSYRTLKWFVLRSQSPLILGDTGCLFEIEGQRRFKPSDDKGDQIVNIYLPIASHRLLVGTSHASVPLVDVTEVNNAIAKCAYEYFVSSTSCETVDDLTASIGLWSGLLTKNEMETLLAEIVEDIDRVPGSLGG
ncbi:MAG: DUF4238 domain-containing protein [Pyrinomonadaceae bacterium]